MELCVIIIIINFIILVNFQLEKKKIKKLICLSKEKFIFNLNSL